MSVQVLSLSSASTGTGVVADNGVAATTCSILLTTTAGVSSGTVVLEGSPDNNIFTVLATVFTNTPSAQYTVLGTGSCQFVRARVTSNIVGGTVNAIVTAF